MADDNNLTVSEDKKTDATVQETQKTEDTKKDSIFGDDIKNSNVNPDEFRKMQELIKKLNSNFDRVNTEKGKLEKELGKMREQTLTQKQLEELKQQELEAELKKKEDEINSKSLKFEKTQFLYEKKLDPEFLEMVEGNDIERFKDNVKLLQDKIKKIVLNEVEIEVNRRLANANPIPQSNSNIKKEDIFSIEELETLPKKFGVEWTKQNMEKINKSMKYYNDKRR